MDEESADFGRVSGGIEKAIFANRSVIAAEKSLAITPAAAADKNSGASGSGFDDEISFVSYKLRVEPENKAS